LIIDCHGHFTTAPKQLAEWRRRQLSESGVYGATPGISDDDLIKALEGRQIKEQRDRGLDMTLFSPIAGQMGHHLGTLGQSVEWSVVCNDLIHRVCALYPDNFAGVCQLPQSPGVNPRNCAEELDRCVNGLGFIGCNINPDVSGGVPPFTPSIGSEWWYPLWEKMVELDIPGMVHASSTLVPSLHVNGSHYVNQDTAAVVELCNSRVFDDFPKLKLIVPHGGGAIPYQFNRHRALHVQTNRKPFEEVVRNLYFDLAIYDQDSMEMLIRKIGIDRVMFATEMFGTAQATDPKTGRGFDDTVDMVKSIKWLSDDERHKIFEGNARKVYSRGKW